ncbi:ROK family transcriptional regulator [Paenibacillus sp. BSR1-1]|uniref:ROK family transcriptional regulator n=1 Tax=Paenibacillus sp. BSR1-1 TaxID=3020845 RepID=UPI0025AF1AF6|nr:ROK family transcriptional regulator [Paenibacillus sp. BSR1-1]MDN3016855.1 ROK family transcriptional regulator [Paenibacillus sp. BSR1-1]
MRMEILRGIRKSLLELGSATKVELSEKLGISFPTISKFLSQMGKNGELISVGLDDSSGGRRAKRYTYNPEYMLGLAIFLEKTETNYIVFNCLGEVKDAGKTSSALIDDDLKLLTHCVVQLIEKYPKINSVAIGVPGSVDNGRIIYIPGYEHLQSYDLKGYLENRFSIPVVIENDMNAAVLGYHDRKGKKKNKSLVYLYSGQNGPGAGIMVNGVVVRGSTNFSGEVRFVPQYDDRNFGQALENGNETKGAFRSEEFEIDAISRLVASLTAIINPHTFIFCEGEVDQLILDHIAERSSRYIPAEHLPNLIMSDWKQDYLFGLQSLGLELMISEISN